MNDNENNSVSSALDAILDPFKGGMSPQLRDIRESKEKHGNVTEVCWESSSMGMAFNSNTRHSVRIFTCSDENHESVQYIVTADKESGCDEVTRELKAVNDPLRKIKELVDRENLAAWNRLRNESANIMRCTDYSSSSSLTISFDDPGPNGYYAFNVRIDPGAAYYHGGGSVMDELKAILDEAVEKAVPTKVHTTPFTGFMGLFDMKPRKQTAPVPVKPAGNPWMCPNCNRENTGKFCPDCGTPCKICQICGCYTYSRFCPECGAELGKE